MHGNFVFFGHNDLMKLNVIKLIKIKLSNLIKTTFDKKHLFYRNYGSNLNVLRGLLAKRTGIWDGIFSSPQTADFSRPRNRFSRIIQKILRILKYRSQNLLRLTNTYLQLQYLHFFMIKFIIYGVIFVPNLFNIYRCYI